MQFIVASNNVHKIEEIRLILRSLPLTLVGLKELGFKENIEENGTSFKENAYIKAAAIAEKYPHCYVMADDSGLSIDCLDGRPGILSARYMGEDTSYEIKNKHLIEEVNSKASTEAERTARFSCAICCFKADGSHFTVESHMEGFIAHESAGSNGFGYDPIFFLPEYGKTSAEIETELKNTISHRAKALKLMLFELNKGFKEFL